MVQCPIHGTLSPDAIHADTTTSTNPLARIDHILEKNMNAVLRR